MTTLMLSSSAEAFYLIIFYQLALERQILEKLEKEPECMIREAINDLLLLLI